MSESSVLATRVGPGAHPLDNPVWSSLAGPHAWLAQRRGRVARYPGDVSPFGAFSAAQPGEVDWRDLAELAGPGIQVSVMGMRVEAPSGFDVRFFGAGVQMVAEEDETERAIDLAEVERLGAGDVPDMLDLTARTTPGPFLPRTVELGTYLGIRRGGRLVAMAGERLRPPGWTEISAVCTDEAWRGQGLARRLVLALAAGIRERGETPFLHVIETNHDAIRLYETLGFRSRRTTSFTAIRTPDLSGS